MTVREAEADAARLLASSWWNDARQAGPLPVDPIEIARSLGVLVQEAILPLDESGKIVMLADGDAVISLNALDHPNRQRFTCAHEIGHYRRRQRQRRVSQTIVDYRDTLAGLGQDPEEIYANQFAAALLMPAHLVQDGVRRGEHPDALARKFGTSTQAMNVRLRNLRLS